MQRGLKQSLRGANYCYDNFIAVSSGCRQVLRVIPEICSKVVNSSFVFLSRKMVPL